MTMLEEEDMCEDFVDGHHSMPVHSEVEGSTSKVDHNAKRRGLILVGIIGMFLISAIAGLSIGLHKKSKATVSSATTSHNTDSGSSTVDASNPEEVEIVVIPEAEEEDEESQEESQEELIEEFVEEEEQHIQEVLGNTVQEQTSNSPQDEVPGTNLTTNEETTSPATSETQGNDDTRLASIIKFLADNGISERSVLETEGSYANKAVKWMAFHDPLALSLPGTDTPSSAGSNTTAGTNLTSVVALVTEEVFLTRYALSILYYATGGIKWEHQANFLSEKPSCEWYEVVDSVPLGVGCNENGQIASLFLKNNKLQNALPSELSYFSNLIMFDLDINFISGSLPDTFASLTKLEHLHIGSNGLTGSLPSWIGKFTRLSTLNLGYNTMRGELPSELSSLPALKELALDHNAFQGDVNKLFGSSISGLRHLEDLFLDSNTFVGTLSETFAAKMRNLTQLDLSDNAFEGPVPKHLFNFTKLEVLDIHDNIFTSLPDTISENTALTFLAAQKNVLGGSIGSSLVNLTGLKHLDLSQNEFTGAMPESIGETLGGLTYLFLAQNHFDAGPIPLSFSNLGSLQELSLKSTQRTGVIPDTYGLLTKLVFMDLDNNELAGAIPPTFGALTNLKLLLLSRNHLVNRIPAEFNKLSKLEVLFLEGNNITGGLDAVCGIPEGKEIEIVAQCSLCKTTPDCCTKCCKEGEACNNKTHVADLDPIWQLSYQRVEFTLDSENWND